MAAVDLDGTLLGPDLTISAANRTAVETLQSAGIEVVLASGRHHSSMSPFAAILPAVRWIVSAQGGEVSDVSRTQMLSQTFLPRDKVTAASVVQSEIGLTPLFYTPEGIFTEAPPSEPLAFYTGLSGLVPVRVERAEVALRSIYKVVWIGTEEVVDTLTEDPRVASLAVQTVIGAFASYLTWMWLLRHYPATQMSSFTFLTPVFALVFGVLLLNEPLTVQLMLALCGVAIGIVLVNRRRPAT